MHILHIKPHAVVPNEYHQVICIFTSASDPDFGLRGRAREFDRVGNKTNEYEPQFRTISREIGSAPIFQAMLRPAASCRTSDRTSFTSCAKRLLGFSPPDPRKRQQIVNPISHALGRVQDHCNIPVAFFIDNRSDLLLQSLGITRQSGLVPYPAPPKQLRIFETTVRDREGEGSNPFASIIFSPSSKRPTKRTRSSITEHSFEGIASSPRGGGVTYVFGTNCHPCVGSLTRLEIH